MKMLIPFIIAAVLYLLILWFRREGKGGKIGQALRNSDWHAWNMAVKDKERELDELKSVEPKR